MNRIMGTKIQV